MNDANRTTIDDTLTRFFRAEMPQPWPACPLPEPAAPSAARSGARRGRRLLLAASLLLGFGAYVALGGLFSARTPTANLDHRQDIGKGLERTHKPALKVVPAPK